MGAICNGTRADPTTEGPELEIETSVDNDNKNRSKQELINDNSNNQSNDNSNEDEKTDLTQNTAKGEPPTKTESKKLDTDMWYEEETFLWVKAAFDKTGYWEYRLKKVN